MESNTRVDNKRLMVVLLDNGHGVTTKGKRSPDGRLLEYAYAREIVAAVAGRLKADGYRVETIVPEQADIRLGERCARVNSWCDKVGAKRVLLVSVHVNAAGMGDRWMEGRGWEAWTSPGQTQGDMLAECLYESASDNLPPDTPLRVDMTDGDRDKEARYAILTGTKCPAVLTENLFQDNRSEVDYLLSAEGREAIIRLHVEGIKDYIERYGK